MCISVFRFFKTQHCPFHFLPWQYGKIRWQRLLIGCSRSTCQPPAPCQPPAWGLLRITHFTTTREAHGIEKLIFYSLATILTPLYGTLAPWACLVDSNYLRFMFVFRGRISGDSRCSRRCPPACLSRPPDKQLRVSGYASPDKVLPTWTTTCSCYQVSASCGQPCLRVPVPVNGYGDHDSGRALAGIEQIVKKLDTAPLPGI